MSNRNSVAELISWLLETFPSVQLLVNNAGVLPVPKRAEVLAREDWDRTLEVNLTAPWALSVGTKSLMKSGGVIVNIASTASYYPGKGLVAYDVSKAGLVMLTRVLALEWASSNIRVIGVAPGKVDTELLGPIKAYTESHGLQFNPQRRLGNPAEVASLVSFLASDVASYITGVVIPIDGGELLETSNGNY